jgi:hypothetical protein
MYKLTRTPIQHFVEIILSILGVVLFFLLLALLARGGPLSTDVIWYANVSLNGIKDPFILNRYFNVFLQAIFIKLAPSPLIGLQEYWAFLIALTCGLIYLAARIFSHRSQVLHALLAVALFLSIGSIADTAGMPLVDVAAMMMVMLFTSMFILSARRGHKSVRMLAVLGFLFYLGFKTKEATLPAGLLLFGLGMTVEQSFNWRLLFRRLLYVLIGFLIGMIFFVILNTIFLHDPLFGFRLSDIRAFINSYVSGEAGAQKFLGSDNWFTAFFFTSLLVPFILYLISAAKAARELESYPGMRLVWLVPLAVIIFVTISIGNSWGFNPRYIFPSLPFICFLAPQFLNLDLAATSGKKGQIWAILVFMIGLVLILLLRVVLRSLVPHLGWDNSSFLAVVFIPVLLSIILALAFYWKESSLSISLLITILVIAIITIPLVKNGKTMISDHPNLDSSQLLFYPFSAFSDQIHYSSNMQMYFSWGTWVAVGMGQFAKDRNEISSLFNIYFDVGSTKTNFALPTGAADIPHDLLSTGYTYALLSLKDWNSITKNQSITSQLEQKYKIFLENRNLVVLLQSR